MVMAEEDGFDPDEVNRCKSLVVRNYLFPGFSIPIRSR